MQVAPDRISVVIQGPLFRQQAAGIDRCVASVRAVLPGAEVIVSTWEQEDVTGLDNVVLVRSQDPGGWPDLWGFGYNLTRQIVSTRAGLARAGRDYVLKLRADLALTSAALCQHLPVAPGGLLSARIVMSNLFVRDPEKMPLLFHISDIAQFGTRQDMQELWACALPNQATLWVEAGINCLSSPFHLSRQRQCPEQYLTIDWLNRRGRTVWLTHPADLPAGMVPFWGDVLWRNFALLAATECGIRFPRRLAKSVRNDRTLLTVARFATLPQRPFATWRCWWQRFNPACPRVLPRLWGTGMKLLAHLPERPRTLLWDRLRLAKQRLRRWLGYPPSIVGKY